MDISSFVENKIIVNLWGLEIPQASIYTEGDWDSTLESTKKAFDIFLQRAMNSENFLFQIKEVEKIKPSYKEFKEDSDKYTEFAMRIDKIITEKFKSLNWLDAQKILRRTHLGPLPQNQQEILPYLRLLLTQASKEAPYGIPALNCEHFANALSETLVKWTDLSIETIIPLMHYLVKFNFQETPKEKIGELLQAASQLNEIAFSSNFITSDIKDLLEKQILLRYLKITSSKIEKFVTISFEKFNRLKSLTINNFTDFNQTLTFPSTLNSFSLKTCRKFNGQIIFENNPSIEKISIEDCGEWNHPLTIKKCSRLKELTINFCKTWNQELDLSGLFTLTKIEIISCRKWNSPLHLLEKEENKKRLGFLLISLKNCELFNQPLDLVVLPNLTELILNGCASFNQPLEFHANSKLELVDLDYCTELKQTLKVSKRQIRTIKHEDSPVEVIDTKTVLSKEKKMGMESSSP